ncbi:unnamed protein product [Adineta steineri]|uniref:Uncharacterized protein n=1 Tax=Adineta steineri TaxID=433720 RepID=A0A819UX63_9BILA|nr:unnamed protein product [Adineta steineri]CAF4087931.1 unnamed protein product [Adineta steineri]
MASSLTVTERTSQLVGRVTKAIQEGITSVSTDALPSLAIIPIFVAAGFTPTSGAVKNLAATPPIATTAV